MNYYRLFIFLTAMPLVACTPPLPECVAPTSFSLVNNYFEKVIKNTTQGEVHLSAKVMGAKTVSKSDNVNECTAEVSWTYRAGDQQITGFIINEIPFSVVRNPVNKDDVMVALNSFNLQQLWDIEEKGKEAIQNKPPN